MLRVVVCQAAEAAKRYYGGGLARGDYYEKEAAGVWDGKGAERLGLQGEVGREEFVRLCENERPDDAGPLTERTKANRRVGYDLNFHCPKSVSILHALTGDPAILEAFRGAVAETMRGMEAEMKARVRAGGASSDRVTGNLVWATFVHTTSRPIDGVPDPHLHAHCFTFNATWDPVEGRWKAGQFGDLKRDARYFEACFHAVLAGKLTGAGYSVERRGKGWEVAGVPESLVQKFSRRTAEIEAVAKARGITDAGEKAELGARTRRSKEDALPAGDVRTRWELRLSPSEREWVTTARGLRPGPLPGAASDSVDFALAHHLERASVVPERKLLESALRHGVGRVSPEAVREELAARPLLRRDVEGQRLATTREVLKEEERMIAFAREGRNTCRPWSSTPDLSATPLNAGQRAAVQYLLTSTDRVMVIRGKAGTGKTTLMQEAVSRIEASGRRVNVFAPTAEASRGVLRREGFGEADTVARLLADPKLQERIQGGVVWVDEAGLLGCRSMGRLFELARAQNARVVLSGDSGQHRSVDRGDALRVLERDAGLGLSTLRDVLRQKGDYKAAIEALGDGRVDEGFRRLERLGAVREAVPDTAHREIALAYTETLRAGKTALVVSPTHAESRDVTAAVRAHLAAQGLLGEGRDLERLQSLGATAAERGDPHLYRPGLVVEFHQNAKGFRAGSRHEVYGKDDAGNVLVKGSDGTAPLPLAQADKFEVFERQRLELARGDVLRVTKNGRVPAAAGETLDGTRQLVNGSLHTVKRFTKDGDLQLENGWVVPKGFGHLAHGYCVTSHASQGKTVDRVFIAQSSRSFAASSAEQFYVSASRARERVVVYTDDKTELLDAVRARDTRMAAVDLVRGNVHPAFPDPGTLPRTSKPPPQPARHREPDRGR